MVVAHCVFDADEHRSKVKYYDGIVFVIIHPLCRTAYLFA